MAILDKKAVVTTQTSGGKLITGLTLTNINPDTTVVTDEILYTAIQKLISLSADALIDVQLTETRYLRPEQAEPANNDGGDIPSSEKPEVVTDP